MNGIRLGGTTLIAIAYDSMGRRKSLSRGDGSVASYDYDGASRLTKLVDDLPAAGDRSVDLTYNPASQIIRRLVGNSLYAWAGHGNGSSITPADGLNRTTAVDGTPLGYDAKGNMTFDGTRAFAYDSENRLRIPSAPYHYDPLGRLAGASLSPGGPLAIVYDNGEGEGLIAERTPGSSTVQRRHVFGPGVDEPLVWYEGAGTAAPRYLHADERGSIVAVADGSGAVQNFMRYDEYGRTENSNPYWQSRFGFTGQRYFGGVGLYYYKARFYHPKLGRFMQVDPIGYDDQINLYVYVENDPVNNADPDGQTVYPTQGMTAAAKSLWDSLSPQTKMLIASGVDAAGVAWDVATIFTGVGSGPEGVAGSRVVSTAIRQSVTRQMALRAQLFGQQIGRGHAWTKHGGEFKSMGIKTRGQFERYIERTVYQGRDVRQAKDGRRFYIDHQNKSVVITDTKAEGTAFRPNNWEEYLKRLPSRKIDGQDNY